MNFQIIFLDRDNKTKLVPVSFSCFLDFSLKKIRLQSVTALKSLVTIGKKVIGKHLCQTLFLNKVTSHRPTTFLKKRLLHKCFPKTFLKFLRTTFLTEYLRWLLLQWKCYDHTIARVVTWKLQLGIFIKFSNIC